MFRAMYESPWQHPGIAFFAGIPLLVVGLLAARATRHDKDADPRRRAWVTSFFVLELAILVDAWLTGGWTPLGKAEAEVAAGIFVVLGDLRFFYLVERQRGPVAPGARAAFLALTIALPVSLLVPITAAIARYLAPTRLNGSALFLAYEVTALVVMIAFGLARRPLASDGADQRRRYVRRLLVVVGVQYALWAIADTVILSGRDVGYLVRLVPNAIYYAAFVPIACLATPAGSRT